ncbi:MAG: GNAT family N-acetyltransferase [Polyangiaceae bacterium]|nr:GNAT family N-acetyltransferase [Polyangiaceae bacterium]
MNEPASDVRIMLAGPEHIEGLAELFHAAGSPCFCRFWHFTGTNNEWLDVCANAPRENADVFARALAERSDEARGIVALHEGRVVGWLKVAPASVMRKAYERRFYKQLPVLKGDREGVFLIGCALVHPAYRKRGVAKALVGGAVELAPSLGASVLEALPCRPNEPAVMDEALWTGPMGAFMAHGFVEVGGFEMYPVLRKTFAPR